MAQKGKQGGDKNPPPSAELLFLALAAVGLQRKQNKEETKKNEQKYVSLPWLRRDTALRGHFSFGCGGMAKKDKQGGTNTFPPSAELFSLALAAVGLQRKQNKRGHEQIIKSTLFYCRGCGGIQP